MKSTRPAIAFAVAALVVLDYAAINSVSARVCILGTEPDEATGGKVRFVLPSGDPCTCTEVKLGGHDKYAPPRRDPPVYIDIHDLRAVNADEIRRLFNCVASNPSKDERVSTGTPQEPKPVVHTTVQKLKPIIHTTVPDMTTVVTPTPKPAADCQAILDAGHTTSGIYIIYHGVQPMQVYCRMKSGQGYIVFQRRINGNESFDRTWQEYRDGFGSLQGEFWLGNEKLRQFTDNETERWELVITMTSFDGQEAAARYHKFSVSEDMYVLDVGGYQVTTGIEIDAGESLIKTHLTFFTTKDIDNDRSDGENCAERFGGGWWFINRDIYSNLNGLYSTTQAVTAREGIQWKSWLGDKKSLRGCEMKMRRSPS